MGRHSDRLAGWSSGQHACLAGARKEPQRAWMSSRLSGTRSSTHEMPETGRGSLRLKFEWCGGRLT